MITRFATLTSRLAAAFAFLFVVTACGGGGGGGGGGGFLPDDGSGDYSLGLALYDPVGNPTSRVTSTEPATLEVTVKRKGNRASDVLVEADPTIGTVFPASGTALSNADGIATFEIRSEGELGGGSVNVSIQEEGVELSRTVNFEIAPAALRLGHFDGTTFVPGEIGLVSDTLPRSGTTVLTVVVVDGDGNPVDTVETIEFTSDCVRSGQATLPPTMETVEGRAEVEYTASSCSGQDTITATLAENTASAQATLQVASDQFSSIVFDSVEHEVLALQGTGGGSGLQETGYVYFRVTDNRNEPQPGVPVSFALTTEVGGIRLVNTTDVSDSEGRVQALVRSGDVATSVRVIATITTTGPDGSEWELSTVSDALAVTTGLPDQNSISISSEFLAVPDANQINGVTSEITVHMADRFNNPVPDGTTATFRTEYGSIDGSCNTTGGECTVTWTSQSPRCPVFNGDYVRTTRNDDNRCFAAPSSHHSYSCPSHNGTSGPCPDDLGWTRGLRTTILVTALGEESFIDQNGNGRYDQGEPFDNLTEAYIDHNEDGRFTPEQGCPLGLSAAERERCEIAGSEETFVDFDSDGLFDYGVSPSQPDGVYNGTLCPPEGDGNWCSRELVHVRDQMPLIVASQWFDVLVADRATGQVTGTFSAGRSYNVYVADIYNNQPPGDATVTFTADDAGAPEGAEGCEVLGETSFEVVDSNLTGAYTINGVQTQGIGTVTISVDAGGAVSNWTFSCSDASAIPEPEDECDFSPLPEGCEE